VSFRLKTIIGVALIEAVLLALLIVVGLRWLQDSNEDQLRERALTTAQVVRHHRQRCGAGDRPGVA
jgi:two-component system sensor histidine kinase/response regulator